MCLWSTKQKVDLPEFTRVPMEITAHNQALRRSMRCSAMHCKVTLIEVARLAQTDLVNMLK